MSRRYELISGLASAVLAIAGVLYALYGPISRYSASIGSSSTDGTGTTTTVTTTGWSSLAQHGLKPDTLIFYGIILGIALLPAVGAYLHSQHGLRVGYLLLVGSTAVVCLGVFVASMSIGVLLAPAALTALVATVLASDVRLDPAASPPS